jgi:protein TonB
MHEQGRVLIRVLVSADGHPERIELKTSRPAFPRLDQSALEHQSWKFVPARQGTRRSPRWLSPIAFTLDG